MEELIKKQKEELVTMFKGKFPNVVANDALMVYNWHINSIKEILEAEVELEREKLEKINGMKATLEMDEIVPSFVVEVLTRERIKHLTNIISNLK